MDHPLSPLNLKAAIHIGASSISLLITDHDGQQIDYLAKSTSIAHDIFSRSSITRTTIEQCVSTLSGYTAILQEYNIALDSEHLRIVAANIVAEASNKDIFINRLQVGCNITVEVLDDGEMTRLIYMKTQRRLNDTKAMQENNTLVIHVGPGNTRVLFFQKGKIESYNSYRLGTHRVGEAIKRSIDDDQESHHVMTEHIDSQLDSLLEEYRDKNIQEIVTIGHEIQLISRHLTSQKNNPSRFPLRSLSNIITKLITTADDDIVSSYNIPYHTAESLLPALTINHSIAKALGINNINIPGSVYERGLLQDIHLSHTAQSSFTEEVTSSAWALAKKFRVNKKHAKHVTQLTLHLFDSLQDLHKLGDNSRLLLHCAALLHESGGFIAEKAHHKHSLYLILHSDIFGLSQSDIKIIALIARYHRNSPPKPSHLEYADLDTQSQMHVSKLASILRIADALDRTHSSRINDIELRLTKKYLHIHLPGIDDVTVERIAMKSKANLFQNIFGLEINIHENK